jgi:hypothetical protein
MKKIMSGISERPCEMRGNVRAMYEEMKRQKSYCYIYHASSRKQNTT